ncbi:MAG: NAD-dependent epimerase/dehydratase family protein [Candidatus Heimdallarchaeota archaeon]|nr:MAG: NAD-dependent epimerase/dehydratase family protein [Candidatus Heimdallarchaeota archaeon]
MRSSNYIESGIDKESDLCLVTGACGFVGSHLVDILLSQDVPVRATDLSTANPKYLPSKGIEFVTADLTKPREIKAVVADVTRIFHPAGIFNFSTAPKLLYKVNVEGTTNLLSAALSENISHVVNWSSAMVYGTLQYTPADEKHPIHPEDPYSESKWVQEQIALSFFEENRLPVSVIRPTAIYGPRSFYGSSNAFLAFVNGKIFGIPGSGKIVQHHVHVEDVARAAIFISGAKKTVGEVYNIADEVPISIEESFRILSELINKTPPKLHIPKLLVYFYGFLDRLWNKLLRKTSLFEKTSLKLIFSDHIFDNSKLKKLGFQYAIPSFEKEIESTLYWYKQQGYVDF